MFRVIARKLVISHQWERSGGSRSIPESSSEGSGHEKGRARTTTYSLGSAVVKSTAVIGIAPVDLTRMMYGEKDGEVIESCRVCDELLGFSHQANEAKVPDGVGVQLHRRSHRTCNDCLLSTRYKVPHGASCVCKITLDRSLRGRSSSSAWPRQHSSPWRRWQPSVNRPMHLGGHHGSIQVAARARLIALHHRWPNWRWAKYLPMQPQSLVTMQMCRVTHQHGIITHSNMMTCELTFRRMKAYHDDTLLVHMNLPGTHDADTWNYR